MSLVVVVSSSDVVNLQVPLVLLLQELPLQLQLAVAKLQVHLVSHKALLLESDLERVLLLSLNQSCLVGLCQIGLKSLDPHLKVLSRLVDIALQVEFLLHVVGENIVLIHKVDDLKLQLLVARLLLIKVVSSLDVVLPESDELDLKVLAVVPSLDELVLET